MNNILIIKPQLILKFSARSIYDHVGNFKGFLNPQFFTILTHFTYSCY